jgi:hypothetical protein
MATILETATVRCSCGKFYVAQVMQLNGAIATQFRDVTRMDDRWLDVGPHECPDNRIKWHGPPGPLWCPTHEALIPVDGICAGCLVEP